VLFFQQDVPTNFLNDFINENWENSEKQILLNDF